jgi:hypothetical protein
MYNNTLRKAAGYAVSEGEFGRVERDTHQCCHCGGHFDYVPGSGKIRGFCTKCMKITCGAEACMECFPIEARMEALESGRTSDLMASKEAVLPKHKKLIIPF